MAGRASCTLAVEVHCDQPVASFILETDALNPLGRSPIAPGGSLLEDYAGPPHGLVPEAVNSRDKVGRSGPPSRRLLQQVLSTLGDSKGIDRLR